MNKEELRQTFESLLRSSVSSVQLNRLIHRSIRIAAGILKSRFSRYLIILSDAGYTPESAASRCVEGLFLPHNDCPCARLTNYIRTECVQDGLILNGDCELALQRCIYFNVQQNIPELLGEFDPQYKKILRMVLETVSKNGKYRRHRDYLDDMISRADDNHLQQNLPAMSSDSLIAELSRRASPDDSTHVLMDKFFDILDEHEGVRRLVPIGQLVTILRDFFQLYWTFGSTEESEGDEVLFDAGDAERIIEPILIEISTRILASYLQRGSMSEDEATHFKHALRLMLDDLAGGNAAPWFEYYKKEFPDISYDNYRDSYRGRFEYVLGSAKELFFLRCRKYFQSDFSAPSG